MLRLRVFLSLLAVCSIAAGQTTRPAAAPATRPAWNLNSALPTVFLAGDSTAANGDPTHTGWGRPFGTYIDHDKANWVNAAIAGRSSRTYVTEGRWDRIRDALKPGDIVLIQFGHNDAGLINDKLRARASLPGLGDETTEIDNLQTGQHEVVHTYGWYMKKMVEETKAKDATPILIGITLRNNWTDGRIERANGQFSEWTKQIAEAEHVAYIDLPDMAADRFEKMGEAAVTAIYNPDKTHTLPAAAAINAELVLSGIKELHRQLFIKLLSSAARHVNPATQPSVVLARFSNSGSNIDKANFVNLQYPADPKLPSIIVIGDSTVRNGRDDGNNGQWGWGDAFGAWIDPDKANVVNRALGGTTATSFMNSEWKGVLDILKPGDFVLIQFGTNPDIGAPKGIGEETAQTTTRGGATVLAHTYGWELRKYIADVRAKGATPLICTLVPHNTWREGKWAAHDDHADWAREVAADQKVGLLDLYKTASARYAALGQKGATAEFADGGTHTNHMGAELLATVVVDELKALPEDPVAGFLLDKPAPTW